MSLCLCIGCIFDGFLCISVLASYGPSLYWVLFIYFPFMYWPYLWFSYFIYPFIFLTG